MNCLLCHRELPLIFSFADLFLLRQPEQALCERCLKSFSKISENHCPRCWKDKENSVCKDCQDWENRGIIIQHQAVFNYNEAMHDFFRQYKFLGDYRLRSCFAQYFAAYFHQEKSYSIVPIPLSKERLASRGFNQVTAFLEAAKLPYQNLLEKSDTLAQSSLTRTERLAAKNSFRRSKTDNLPQKVILVDDIYTTGATLQLAIAKLQEAGITEIKSFSLCR